MGLDHKNAFGKRWSRGNGLLPPDKDFVVIKAIKDAVTRPLSRYTRLVGSLTVPTTGTSKQVRRYRYFTMIKLLVEL